MLRLRVIVVLCSLITAATAWTDGRRHPQDGPDADVRMSVEGGLVTLDIAMNLAFCDAVVDTEREDEWALPDVERPYVVDALASWFGESLVVEVGGERLALSRSSALDLPPPDLSLLPLFPITGTKGVINVGIKLEFEFDGEPKRVALTWPAFPESAIPGLGPIEVNVQLVALGVAEVITVTRDEPGFAWHAPKGGVESRFLAVPEAAPRPTTFELPLISLGLVLAWLVLLAAAVLRRSRRALVAALVALPLLALGAWVSRGAAIHELEDPFSREEPLPNATAALAIFEPLHRNIYKAFDFTRESDVYDALARSVDGALLDSLYDEVYQSLIMREEGGAVSRVEAVRYLDREVIASGALEGGASGFTVRARWQVDGAVFHWGHAHHRTNEHEAEYTVVRSPAGWRIAGSRMLEQRRVESTPGSAR